MTNFFTPIPAQKASIYYLTWLLNSYEDGSKECTNKAEIFIHKCYFFSKNNLHNKINRIQVVYSDKKELHCLVDNNLLVIRVDINHSLFNMLSDKELDARFMHEKELDELVLKYNVKDYTLIFLETKYTGNILQIEKETPYNVFPLYNYVDFLLSFKCDKCEQIDSEFSTYVKNIVDSYLKYNTLEYDKWSLPQYHGFYKDLQFHLQDGEGKHNTDYGDLWYFDVFEKEVNGVILYFRLQNNTNKVMIRACFDSIQEKKKNRTAIQNEVLNSAKNLNLLIVNEKHPGRSKCTTLGSFSVPVIQLNKNGTIDRKSTIHQLKQFKAVLDNISQI